MVGKGVSGKCQGLPRAESLRWVSPLSSQSALCLLPLVTIKMLDSPALYNDEKVILNLAMWLPTLPGWESASQTRDHPGYGRCPFWLHNPDPFCSLWYKWITDSLLHHHWQYQPTTEGVPMFLIPCLLRVYPSRAEHSNIRKWDPASIAMRGRCWRSVCRHQ